jgi:hypothetical protein
MSTNKGIFLWWIRVITKKLPVYISLFIWFIFLLTPGFAPLTNWIGQAVGAAIFYSILILSRLDNSPLKSQQDKRPARTFNIKWQVGRDWLVFDADHNDMKCRLCIDYHARSGKQDNLKQKHLFVTGCTNFRTSTIVDQPVPTHLPFDIKCPCRTLVLFIFFPFFFGLYFALYLIYFPFNTWFCPTYKLNWPGSHQKKTPAYKSLLAINQHNRKIISYKFRNVHAVIKHNRPFSDYVWQLIWNDLSVMLVNGK